MFFGAWVTLECQAGNLFRYRIVGADELDLKQKYISVDSPMAKALLGKTLDDEVCIRTPEGEKEYIICNIEYQSTSG